jgi:hypothetical protein
MVIKKERNKMKKKIETHHKLVSKITMVKKHFVVGVVPFLKVPATPSRHKLLLVLARQQIQHTPLPSFGIARC